MSLVADGFDAWRECRAEYELLEHWQSHPRTCYADFERQWAATREAER